MVRQGGFSLELIVNGRALPEQSPNGEPVALATAGAAFAVKMRNQNQADYLVHLCVDGVEIDPGYLKKLRGNDEAVFRGYVCRRDVHEFLFSKTPVDEEATGRSSAANQLGEVSAAIFATRRVRLESSSSDDGAGFRDSAAAIGARALPEKVAIKEYGVQARPGGAVEELPRYRRRRRGEYRLEKIKPEVLTLRLLYRGSFWFARNDGASSRAATSSATKAAGSSTSRHSSVASTAVKREGEPKKPDSGASSVPAWYEQKAAKPLARRAPGETARAPDGKRRKLARPDGSSILNDEPEVVVLSD